MSVTRFYRGYQCLLKICKLKILITKFFQLSSRKISAKNSILIQDLIANKIIVLVTSASHMKRAIEVISQTNPKKIISAPTNFYGIKPKPAMILNFIPNLNNVAIVARYTHEEIGRFYSIVMN